MQDTAYADYMKLLNQNKHKISVQEFKTLRGQAKHGDVNAATKGLRKLLRRRCR